MHRLGVPGTVRASFGPYNTVADADRLVRGVEQAKVLFGL
jgi:cysteine desulfurase / selenocysteine lyase